MKPTVYTSAVIPKTVRLHDELNKYLEDGWVYQGHSQTEEVWQIVLAKFEQ